MTSRNLFPKLLGDNLKKSGWIIALYSVVLFFCYPVPLALLTQSVQSNLSDGKTDLAVKTLIRFFSTGGVVQAVFVIIMSLLSGLSICFYLHKKVRSDFYHSLPVSRPTLFWANYLAGVLYYLLPMVVMQLLGVLVLVVAGLLPYFSWPVFFISLGLHLLFYLVSYTVCIFAGVLTGNVIVQFFGTMVLLHAPIALYALYDAACGIFYHTYAGPLVSIEQIYSRLYPYWRYLEAIAGGQNGSYDTFSWGAAVGYLAFAGLLAWVCCRLYRIRRNETAEQAMSFGPSRPIIKAVLVLIGALGLGYFFYLSGDGYGWLAFGILIGGLLAHAIVEVIYRFDVRAMFRQMWFCGVELVIIFGLLTVPAFDLTGFDTYLPARSQLTAASINLQVLDGWTQDARSETQGGAGTASVAGYSLVRFTQADTLDALLTLASAAVSDEQTEVERTVGSLGIAPVVCYETGRSKALRSYSTMSLEDPRIQTAVETLYNSPEYKQAVYPILSMQAANFVSVTVFDQWVEQGNRTRFSDSATVAKLVAAYQQDLMEAHTSLTDWQLPQLVLCFSEPLSYYLGEEYTSQDVWDYYERLDSGSWSRSLPYPVYAGFEHTLSLLQELGVTARPAPDMEQMESIEVNWNGQYDSLTGALVNETAVAVPETAQWSDAAVTITDPQQMQALMNLTVSDTFSNYSMGNNANNRKEWYCVCYLVYHDNSGNSWGQTRLLTGSEMPQWLWALLSDQIQTTGQIKY